MVGPCTLCEKITYSSSYARGNQYLAQYLLIRQFRGHVLENTPTKWANFGEMYH